MIKTLTPFFLAFGFTYGALLYAQPVKTLTKHTESSYIIEYHYTDINDDIGLVRLTMSDIEEII